MGINQIFMSLGRGVDVKKRYIAESRESIGQDSIHWKGT